MQPTYTVCFKNSKLAQAFVQGNNKALLAAHDINAVRYDSQYGTMLIGKLAFMKMFMRRNDFIIAGVKGNQVAFS